MSGDAQYTIVQWCSNIYLTDINTLHYVKYTAEVSRSTFSVSLHAGPVCDYVDMFTLNSSLNPVHSRSYKLTGVRHSTLRVHLP